MLTLHVGHELIFDCPQPTPMILTLNLHFTRVSDLLRAEQITIRPSVPITAYRDSFGNWCSRLVAPTGETLIATDATLRDTGKPDMLAPAAVQHAIQDLPEECLVFLLGSRYCETDRLSDVAWSLFGSSPTGWGRVQAICDFVHQHLSFGYNTRGPPSPRGMRTTSERASAAISPTWRSRSAGA